MREGGKVSESEKRTAPAKVRYSENKRAREMRVRGGMKRVEKEAR